MLLKKTQTIKGEKPQTPQIISAYLIALWPIYSVWVTAFLSEAPRIDQFSFTQMLQFFTYITPIILPTFFCTFNVSLLVVPCCQDTNGVRILITLLLKLILFYVPHQILLASTISGFGLLVLELPLGSQMRYGFQPASPSAAQHALQSLQVDLFMLKFGTQ